MPRAGSQTPIRAPDDVTESSSAEPTTEVVEATFREAYGQAVATLIRVFGDITLAEDAVQEAFLVASDRWRKSSTVDSACRQSGIQRASPLDVVRPGSGPGEKEPVKYQVEFQLFQRDPASLF